MGPHGQNGHSGGTHKAGHGIERSPRPEDRTDPRAKSDPGQRVLHGTCPSNLHATRPCPSRGGGPVRKPANCPMSHHRDLDGLTGTFEQVKNTVTAPLQSSSPRVIPRRFSERPEPKRCQTSLRVEPPNSSPEPSLPGALPSTGRRNEEEAQGTRYPTGFDQGEITMTFRGRNRRDVKRKALAYWASHAADLGLGLRAFLNCCRMGPNDQTIIFTVPQ